MHLYQLSFQANKYYDQKQDNYGNFISKIHKMNELEKK